MDDAVGIIGYGRSQYERKPGQGELDYVADAVSAALQSAGLQARDIDGLAISSTTLGGDNAVTAAERLGIALRWARGSVAGGAGALVMARDAHDAIAAGRASHILCVGSGRQDGASFRDRVSRFNRAVGDYLAPHGCGGMNGLFALIQAKHMARYGTTRAQLGRIAVGQRASAMRNPAALLRDAMTLDDYLAAPPIAEPLHLFDCVMPCSGAEAVLLGPRDRAGGRGIAIRATGERYNHRPAEVVPLEGGWAAFRDDLYDAAGWGPDAVDCVQVYDDYPIMAAIQLEDLGFCAKGEVGPFLAGHELSFAGSFPLNTGGGQLSVGQAGGAGGMLGLVEAVQQLRGEAGERQVANARRALVSGYGMVAYGHGLAASALLLETA